MRDLGRGRCRLARFYFTEQDKTRCGIFLIDVQSASDIPAFAEPYFLSFEANCKFRIVMSPEDLQKAGRQEKVDVKAA